MVLGVESSAFNPNQRQRMVSAACCPARYPIYTVQEPRQGTMDTSQLSINKRIPNGCLEALLSCDSVKLTTLTCC